jgi:cytoplasmic iron level regulating protein YaaA (DUF328/UPF0246 family)
VRILLPPSETKLKGGAPHSGRFTLSFPVQDAGRYDLLVPLEILCRDNPAEAVRVLKLGPKSVEELANNVFTDAPVMPAIDRYTGVLYSATNAPQWTTEQREWATRHVFIHSALWGIISSGDEIPNYRLSHDTRIGGHMLASVWGGQLAHALTEMAAGDWVLDARSAGFRDLAPVPPGVTSLYLDVVSKSGGKALNHFNKVHKGELVAMLVADSPELASVLDFIAWAGGQGLSVSRDGEQVRLAV